MAVSFAPQNFHKDNLNIDIIVWFRGRRYKRSSGLSVPREYWLKAEKRCSESRDFPLGASYNKMLKKQREAVDRAISVFSEEPQTPSQAQFWSRVDENLLGVNVKKDGVVEYARVYVKNREGTTTPSTQRTYRSVISMLSRFEKKKRRTLSFRDINDDFYNDFRKFLFAETHGNDNQEYSGNYFGRIIKFIKMVYSDAARNGIHKLPPIDFKVESHTADTVYLTPEELKRMYDVKLALKGEIIARAKFLLGASTGLRISDFNNLESINIGDKFITKVTQKTGKRIIAPINSMAREIIDTTDISVKLTDQFINRTIKKVAREAEITQPVEIIRYTGGRRVSMVVEKCELVSSHTARRSFATNAYKAGVPTLAIMKITGHTTEKSFLKYIKISEEENAEMLASHEFFR